MEPLLAAAMVSLLVGTLLIAGLLSPEQRMRRQLRRHPLVAIADAENGATVRLRGRVCLVDLPLQAPLSERECAAWHVRVEERRGGGKSSSWVTLIDEHEALDFYLEDQRGDRAYVRGSETKLFALPDRKAGAGLLQRPSPQLAAFMAARGLETEGLLFRKHLAAREGVFEPGETVVIAGVVRDEGERSDAPGRRLIRLEALYNDWILASDHPKHGR